MYDVEYAPNLLRMDTPVHLIHRPQEEEEEEEEKEKEKEVGKEKEVEEEKEQGCVQRGTWIGGEQRNCTVLCTPVMGRRRW
jgi:hypothetical protein